MYTKVYMYMIYTIIHPYKYFFVPILARMYFFENFTSIWEKVVESGKNG